MKPSIEKIAIWILEVLEEERQREPDLAKCHPASDVLGVLKSKHGLEDADITRGLKFCVTRGYIDAVNRSDGQAMLPSDDGMRMFAQIQLERMNEQRKRDRLSELANFDQRELSKMDAIALAAWQSKFEKDDPQYKLAEHQWQLRAGKNTRKIAIAAFVVSLLSLGLAVLSYCRPHH